MTSRPAVPELPAKDSDTAGLFIIALAVVVLVAIGGAAYWHQAAKIDALAAEVVRQNQTNAEMTERVIALATENKTAQTAVQDAVKTAADVIEIQAEIRSMDKDLARLDYSINAVREHMAARLSAMDEARTQEENTAVKEKPALPEKPADDAEAEKMARLQRGVMTAFQTLDQQFQLINGRLDSLATRDDELALAQDAALVALQADLNHSRARNSPLLWGMMARLAGLTVRFSEGTELADNAAAEQALQQVATLLLGSDPSLGIRVVGYADFDSTGAAANRITSQKRADYILGQLTRLGVPAERLLAVGRATEDRVVNSDASGNGNRRAVFEAFLLKDAS